MGQPGLARPMKTAANLLVMALLSPLIACTAPLIWLTYYRGWRKKKLVQRRWAATLAFMDLKADLRELWR